MDGSPEGIQNARRRPQHLLSSVHVWPTPSQCSTSSSLVVPAPPPMDAALHQRTSLRSMVCFAATTLSATSEDSKTTNPKPLGRPLFLL